MQVKWNNIIAIGMLLFTLIFIIQNSAGVVAILGAIHRIGPGQGIDDRLVGLAVVGLFLVTLVVVVKLMVSGNRREP
mgnify:CR=1 FL=1